LDCGGSVHGPQILSRCLDFLTKQEAQQAYEEHLNLHQTGIQC
jgi:hypothetical protein